jgi:FAD/FMN-containing dehydrogenase
MANMGDIDRQALAGAISTGTHGTGRSLGSISTQMVGLRLVTASGERLDLSAADEPDLFKAAQVSLGALGVITQVTLQLLPAYYLHEQTFALDFEDCLTQMDSLIETNRHFEFFWSPRDDACAVKRLNPTEAAPGIIAPPAAVPAGSRMARYLNPERVAPSYQIFPSERTIRFNEIEFAVPAANGPDCLREIRQLMQSKFSEVLWPLEYRTLKADEIDLSPAYGRASVTISAHQAAELPYQDFFAAVEAIFRNHHGRPHWGKIHSHSARELAGLYPQWDHFLAVRRQLDPPGRFLNPYLRTLFDIA